MKTVISVALLSCVLSACASSGPEPAFEVSCWGTMREVLREGDDRARVPLARVVEKGTWGVGALAGLEGEVTVIDGKAHVAKVVDEGLYLRSMRPRDEASLLVLASVQGWTASSMVQTRTLSDLEHLIAKRVESMGFDASNAPLPIRIEGDFDELSLHVIDGACPIADPDGSPPWRHQCEGVTGTLVGIYAEGQEGKLTHHARRLHLHALVETAEGRVLSGHVDEAAVGEGAQLMLPRITRGATLRTESSP